MSLSFLVQGSGQLPYEVVFHTEGDKLTALCSCPAGEKGVFCKHRIRLMQSDLTGVVGGAENLSKLLEFVNKSVMKTALIRLEDAEKNSAQVALQLSKAKKDVTLLMYGRA